MTIAEPPSRLKFTRDDYYRMFNMGLFEGQRVELIQGEIIKMSPQNNPHALTCAIVNNWLVKSLSDDFTVRCQLPFVASDDTEPEPDFAVLPGSPQSQQEHPTTALAKKPTSTPPVASPSAGYSTSPIARLKSSANPLPLLSHPSAIATIPAPYFRSNKPFNCSICPFLRYR